MNLKRLMEPKMLPWLVAALLVAVLLLMGGGGDKGMASQEEQRIAEVLGAMAGAGKVEGGGQPGRAAPHHHRVVQVGGPTGVHYSRPTRSRLGFRVSAPGRHLAGHT